MTDKAEVLKALGFVVVSGSNVYPYVACDQCRFNLPVALGMNCPMKDYCGSNSSAFIKEATPGSGNFEAINTIVAMSTTHE